MYKVKYMGTYTSGILRGSENMICLPKSGKLNWNEMWAYLLIL